MDLSSSPGSSADEASVNNDNSTPRTKTKEMGRRGNTGGPAAGGSGSNRGGPGIRRFDLDLSAMLNHEQRQQLQQLVFNIMDTMQRNLRDIFDTMGPPTTDSKTEATSETVQPEPLRGIQTPAATWAIIPNPRSLKYAHLFGLEPVMPVAETKDDEKESDEKDKEKDKDAKEGKDGKEKEKEKPKPPKKEPPKPELVPPAPIIPPALIALASQQEGGILSIPTSIEQATAMVKRDETDVITSSMVELKRDALTHIGKWRSNILRRMGDINIKNGGNGGNVAPAGQGPQQQHQAPGNARRGGHGGGGAGRGRPARPSGGGVSTADEESNAASARLYPAFPTQLSELPKEKRACILHSMLLLLLGLENYYTYSRILLFFLASSLHVPASVLAQDELRVAQALGHIIKGVTPEEIAQKRAEEGRTSRRHKGTASAAAQLAAHSGTLSAPLIAAGIGTVFGGLGLTPNAAAGLLGTMAESTIAVGNLFGLYGARATSKMETYLKDVQDFALLPLRGSLDREYVDPKDLVPEDRRLRLTLGLSGWLMEKEDVTKAWRALGHQNEVYALRWELEALTKLGTSLKAALSSVSWTMAKKEMAERTVFDSLQNSYWPSDLVKISKVIDNPWTVGMVRAEKMGGILADAIINKIQGERAITLVGYSLGARIIYNCLMQLSEKRAFGVVENVVLLGAPCPTEVRVWAAMKSVVAGRLVNVYSNNDYLLGFLYRSSSWQYGVAGLQKIQGLHGIENFDVSEIVCSHLRYQHMVGAVLQKLGWEDIDRNEVGREDEALKRLVSEEMEMDRARGFKTKGGVASLNNKSPSSIESSLVRGVEGLDLNSSQKNGGVVGGGKAAAGAPLPATKRGKSPTKRTGPSTGAAPAAPVLVSSAATFTSGPMAPAPSSLSQKENQQQEPAVAAKAGGGARQDK
ncbi:hypothetical protein PG989_012545 [Apiospora arundinis]|uniref:DUF726-domain-containing protein n=1 Tax=Apiospora arundinis TaxID=335852 RepID=A0ABR2IID5_9PEZI